jgi:RES domain-containing protein
MREIYRLVRADRVDDVLSGEGARLFGGRWNPRGVAVVYGAESRALAVLETFVHLTLEARTMRFVLCTIRLPVRIKVRRVEPNDVPRTIVASRERGRVWVESGDSAVLVVPSAIVPQETNYVLNVRHRHFANAEVGHREVFSFDDRPWRRR